MGMNPKNNSKSLIDNYWEYCYKLLSKIHIS